MAMDKAWTGLLDQAHVLRCDLPQADHTFFECTGQGSGGSLDTGLAAVAGCRLMRYQSFDPSNCGFPQPRVAIGGAASPGPTRAGMARAHCGQGVDYGAQRPLLHARPLRHDRSLPFVRRRPRRPAWNPCQRKAAI